MVMSPPPWEHAIPHHQRLLLLTQLLNEKGLELSNAYDCCRGSARVGQQGHKPRDTHCPWIAQAALFWSCSHTGGELGEEVTTQNNIRGRA
eukprot:461142-Pelagomonas_calceolata.AAC.5